MIYRRLGNSGLQLSALSLGSWITFGNQIDDHCAHDLMARAYDAGINYFDNAEGYAAGRSEELMGRILSKLHWPRDTYVVSSKVFWGGDRPNQTGLSKKHVIEACHGAMRRLRVDYLDLYVCNHPDPNTPIEETVRAMDLLVRQGKVLYWGTSEWSAQQITEAHEIAIRHNLVPPNVEQAQYNLLCRKRVEEEYKPLYSDIGLGLTSASPLAAGYLTGKYNQGIPENSRLSRPENVWLLQRWERLRSRGLVQVLEKLSAIAVKIGYPLPALAVAWSLKNLDVSSVITGASAVDQLDQNLVALELLGHLNEEIMSEIDAAIGDFSEFDA